jgi:hypothetical protein
MDVRITVRDVNGLGSYSNLTLEIFDRISPWIDWNRTSVGRDGDHLHFEISALDNRDVSRVTVRFRIDRGMLYGLDLDKGGEDIWIGDAYIGNKEGTLLYSIEVTDAKDNSYVSSEIEEVLASAEDEDPSSSLIVIVLIALAIVILGIAAIVMVFLRRHQEDDIEMVLEEEDEVPVPGYRDYKRPPSIRPIPRPPHELKRFKSK